MRTLMMIACCLFCTASMATTVYKSVDKQGRVTYSGKRLENTKQEPVELSTKLSPEQQKALQSFTKKSTPSAEQALALEINNAKFELTQAKLILQGMQKRDTDAFNNCEKRLAELKKTKPANVFYVCRHNSLQAYQQEVTAAEQRLNQLQTKLAQLKK